MDELKACPFCGGKVDYIFTDHKNSKSRTHQFVCHNCGADFFLPRNDKYQSAEATEAEAVATFNCRAEPENKPLTIEQLKNMDGEPVWIVIIGRDVVNRHAGWGNAWLSKALTINATQFFDNDLFMEDEYGKTWLAYARKPEQEENHDI
jgi:hypothetical protein